MRLRIVVLSAFLTPHRSGAEACVEEVSGALQHRYDITIVTARLSRGFPRTGVLWNGVPVVRVGLGLPIDKWLFPFLAPFAARRLRPQIIHAVLESFAGLALMFCRVLIPGAKRILTCQSTNTTLLVRAMHKNPHRITVISEHLRKRAEAFGRADAILIPNGLDVAGIPQLPKVPGRILFVGRLRPMKGVDTLLQAFARVPGASQLRIVGDGFQRPMLERMARDLGIADRVTFLGYLPTPDVNREYAEAEIFCGLSRSEALGNVFLEAQAAGCAVLATTVGGIPDIVQDGVTGLLIPPDDPAAAADALSRLLGDSALRDRLGTSGRQNAAAYDWSLLAERYAAAYEDVVRT